MWGKHYQYRWSIFLYCLCSWNCGEWGQDRVWWVQSVYVCNIVKLNWGLVLGTTEWQAFRGLNTFVGVSGGTTTKSMSIRNAENVLQSLLPMEVWYPNIAMESFLSEYIGFLQQIRIRTNNMDRSAITSDILNKIWCILVYKGSRDYEETSIPGHFSEL